MNPDGVCNLVEAIIDRAKRDYQKAIKKPNDRSEYENAAAIESFFHSERFQWLTGGCVTGDEAIRMAKEEQYA